MPTSTNQPKHTLPIIKDCQVINWSKNRYTIQFEFDKEFDSAEAGRIIGLVLMAYNSLPTFVKIIEKYALLIQPNKESGAVNTLLKKIKKLINAGAKSG